MKAICLFIFLFSSVLTMGQDLNDCSSIWIRYDSLSNLLGRLAYGKPPMLTGSLEVNDTMERGKVFVRFIVDTLGNVHCAKVAYSDNERLNAKAIEIIKTTSFTPAEQIGKKVNALMVLPITFGDVPQKKKRRKKKKQ